HRSVDFDPSFLLQNDKGSDTTDDYADGFDFFSQRYRIKAWENGPDPDTSWSNEIIFNFDPVIWVPNAFTPNGDGLNNKFLIVTGSIKTFQIDIYNRWGEFLFTSNDVDVSWDGTFKGEPCQEGVYIYKLRYTGADNMIKVMAGNITLLR
ncbi:MAG TPA: gliding motility-associated C-terminal domain-containing protein, partial [Bacteroidia bacterium]|nr:gliding motility-associated C-terminal domain-containing protein [Bacteroidia bacterium]